MKFPLKTAAIGAVVALGVGATSATAGSLITSAKIKDGSVQMRDLSPRVQKKLRHAASATKVHSGPAGATGASGANGSNGLDGAAGLNGIDGVDGQPGAAGKDGKNADQFDRIVGSCDDDKYAAVGEVSVANGTARLAVPNGMAWAQIKTFPKNLLVSDIDKLSFTTMATDAGQTWMKIATTNHGSIVFDANSQPGGEKLDQMVKNDVRNGTVRWNDDVGNGGQMSWNAMKAIGGNKHVKSISVTTGCALGDRGETLLDELQVNDEVIDFA